MKTCPLEGGWKRERERAVRAWLIVLLLLPSSALYVRTTTDERASLSLSRCVPLCPSSVCSSCRRSLLVCLYLEEEKKKPLTHSLSQSVSQSAVIFLSHTLMKQDGDFLMDLLRLCARKNKKNSEIFCFCPCILSSILGTWERRRNENRNITHTQTYIGAH